MCGAMGDVAWLTPSLQVPGGALPVTHCNVSLTVCYPTCSGHPDDTGEQTSCHICLVVPAPAVLKDLHLTAGSLEQGTELQWEECRACRWRDPESSFPKSLYLCTAWARLHQPRPTQLLQDFDVSLAGSSST